MSKTIIHHVVGIDGATLMVFYTEAHYWQFRLISPGGAVFGERKIYYSAEAALKAGLEWIAWGVKSQFEAMQKSPFRSWNGKYDLAVAQVEQTANKLDNAIAHLQQRQNQLGQWNKQERAYSLWDKSPQTQEMRNLAKGLQSPQLQERLNSIAKVERQKEARSQTYSARQAGLSA